MCEFIIATRVGLLLANWSTQPGWSGAVEKGADPGASAGGHYELPDPDVLPRSIPLLCPPKPRRLDRPVAVSLEDLVPPDHFYRHLEATLDLSFVREWAVEFDAERGRPSIDPVVFFTPQLVMFFEGIRSERVDYPTNVRGYHQTEAFRKAIRKRQVWVESLFAEAKEWHDFRRLRLRGLLNANFQGLLIAAGQHLKRFLVARGRERRRAPCGSLVALPRAAQRLSAVSG